jgi:hypothetical protein
MSDEVGEVEALLSLDDDDDDDDELLASITFASASALSTNLSANTDKAVRGIDEIVEVPLAVVCISADPTLLLIEREFGGVNAHALAPSTIAAVMSLLRCLLI